MENWTDRERVEIVHPRRLHYGSTEARCGATRRNWDLWPPYQQPDLTTIVADVSCLKCLVQVELEAMSGEEALRNLFGVAEA